jgi:hypothetical protein
METGVIEGLFCISFRKFYKSAVADAIRMVLIKIYLIIRSYFLILKPQDASTYLKKLGSVFRG